VVDVDAILDRRARRHVDVAVGVSGAGERLFAARGRAGPDTIFEIGSITKVFTATVLADMALEGLVSLDDPVTGLPVRGRPVTLVDLATHTSGLPRLPKGMLRRALRERGNPYASFTAEDLERAVSEARLRRAPGKRKRYSNFGFGVLGHVLALHAGTDYERLVRTRVCEPVGLADTVVTVPPASEPRFARGHDRRGREVPHWDLAALAGAGALRSTAADMLRFLEHQLRPPDTRLGRAIRLTREPRPLGWHTRDEVFWHNGGTGGFRSFAAFAEASDTAVVVLSSSARWVDRIGAEILRGVTARP
jgi:CubicO group peptidase (beta-lactamase class C family)